MYFSIITCTRNSEKFISRNVNSVEEQTFKDYEQIFIDGESTDRTQPIIRKWVKEDSTRYKLFIYPPNGISNAFNKGIEKSRGKYLIFLNSDDYFFDNSVLADVNSFFTENMDLDWIYGKINVVEEDKKKVGTFPNQKIFQIANRTLLKYINYVPHQAVIMNRKVFDRFGKFDESLKTSMDRDLWLRISTKTKWQFFDRTVACYTIRPGSASSSKEMFVENAARAEAVQKRHLNDAEVILARIGNRVISLINKTRR